MNNRPMNIFCNRINPLFMKYQEQLGGSTRASKLLHTHTQICKGVLISYGKAEIMVLSKAFCSDVPLLPTKMSVTFLRTKYKLLIKFIFHPQSLLGIGLNSKDKQQKPLL